MAVVLLAVGAVTLLDDDDDDEDRVDEGVGNDSEVLVLARLQNCWESCSAVFS